MAACCPVIELRRYRLRPGRTDALIELFEREFVETQEAVGIQVIGQFRDRDEPDEFVWLRGFRDMAARARALETFYTGPAWMRYRDAANGTMINSDNVLLLRPAGPDGGFTLPDGPPPGPDASGSGAGLIVSTICHLAPGTEGDFAEFFERDVRPRLLETSASILATLVTERRPNSFPRLPVREGETVFVWFSGFADEQAYGSHLSALARSPIWTDDVLPAMERRIWCRNDVSSLVPTPRSRLQA